MGAEMSHNQVIETDDLTRFCDTARSTDADFTVRGEIGSPLKSAAAACFDAALAIFQRRKSVV